MTCRRPLNPSPCVSLGGCVSLDLSATSCECVGGFLGFRVVSVVSHGGAVISNPSPSLIFPPLAVVRSAVWFACPCRPSRRVVGLVCLFLFRILIYIYIYKWYRLGWGCLRNYDNTLLTIVKLFFLGCIFAHDKNI